MPSSIIWEDCDFSSGNVWESCGDNYDFFLPSLRTQRLTPDVQLDLFGRTFEDTLEFMAYIDLYEREQIPLQDPGAILCIEELLSRARAYHVHTFPFQEREFSMEEKRRVYLEVVAPQRASFQSPLRRRTPLRVNEWNFIDTYSDNTSDTELEEDTSFIYEYWGDNIMGQEELQTPCNSFDWDEMMNEDPYN